jgi:hypothetical protein
MAIILGFPAAAWMSIHFRAERWLSAVILIAVFGAVELARLGRRWLGVLGVGVALFEVATVLTLRAHYTMDVFTGAVTALLVAGVAAKISPWCDRALAGLTGRKPGGVNSDG